MKIPNRLKEFNFVLVNGKRPIEKGWPKKIRKFNDPLLIDHLNNGGNYGVQSNHSSILIDGKTYFLIIIDFDKKEFQDKVLDKFPETFTTSSGSSKNCYHLWFASDNNKPFKVKDEKMETLCDVIGEGNQVIAPPSKHPSGSNYLIVKDIPFTFIPYSELQAILKPYDKTPKKPIKIKKNYTPNNISDDVTEKIYNSISMQDILNELGLDTSKNPTDCFFHSSVGGKCFGWDDSIAHCFNCDQSWNKFSLIRDAKNLTNKQTFDWFAEKSGMSDELNHARKKYVEIKNASQVFTPLNQAKQFNKIQPLFYDKNGLWWLWNTAEFKWEIVDEVDILNMIRDSTGEDIISPKNRTMILNSLKQEGRRMMPKPIKTSWIQFKDLIVDIETGEEFNASPKYFVTNPIPYSMNKERFINTPKMDKIFEEWVGKNSVQTLYEIIAYCLLPSYPIHRIFCFIGEGMNGKSKFLELLRKFIGSENCCSTELDILLNSRFEVTRLHKKLVCQMGETNFNEMSKTSLLKKLSGGDLIGFEYKNKNPFEEMNYAKILIATNNLPATTDKTIGFYRRWCIIDFPNQFTEKKDILTEIPEEEYGILAVKCLGILKDLLDKREFHNEGTLEQRKENYESKSNFLETFLKQSTDEDFNGYITKADFYKKFSSWSRENRHREMSETSVGLAMKKLGWESEKKYFDWLYDGKGGQARVWIGIKWRE